MRFGRIEQERGGGGWGEGGYVIRYLGGTLCSLFTTLRPSITTAIIEQSVSLY